MGITGELKVNTVEIVATPEEAPEETTELPEGEQEAAPTEENPCSGDRSRGYTCGRFPDR